jgi:hypothetical protein
LAGCRFRLTLPETSSAKDAEVWKIRFIQDPMGSTKMQAATFPLVLAVETDAERTGNEGE